MNILCPSENDFRYSEIISIITQNRTILDNLKQMTMNRLKRDVTDIYPILKNMMDIIPDKETKRWRNNGNEIDLIHRGNVMEADLVIPEDKDHQTTTKTSSYDDDNTTSIRNIMGTSIPFPSDDMHIYNWICTRYHGMTEEEFEKKYSGPEELDPEEYAYLPSNFRKIYDQVKFDRFAKRIQSGCIKMIFPETQHFNFSPGQQESEDHDYNKELSDLCKSLSDNLYEKTVDIYPYVIDDTINNLGKRLLEKKITKDDIANFKKAIAVARHSSGISE